MGAIEDLRSQIKFRGLKASGNQDPVSEFKGLLTGFDIEEQRYQDQATGRNNVVLHFSEVDIIASDPPYPYPTKDVIISYSDRIQSRWGIFAESGLKFLAANEDFSNLVGRRLHLKIEVHKLFQGGKDKDGKDRGEQPTNCWTIADIEGAGTAASSNNGFSAETQLLLLLSGKTEQQFNLEALRSPIVKQDSSLMTRILNRTWFTELTAKNLVQKDEAGIYSLTAEGLQKIQS